MSMPLSTFIKTLERATSLLPVYCISSESPLLQREALNALWEKSKTFGFETKQRYFADQHFQWRTLLSETQQRNLFCERKLVVVHLYQKISTEGANIISELFDAKTTINHKNTDTVFVFIAHKIEGAQKNAKWLKIIEKVGLWCDTPQPKNDALLKNIQQRLTEKSFQADQKTLATIAEYCVGNIDAAAQLIEQLSLAFKPGNITTENVTSLMTDQSQYGLFDAIDAALLQQPQKMLSALKILLRDSTQLPLLLWAACYKLRLLLKIKLSPNAVPSRDFTIQKSEKLFSKQHCQQLLSRAHLVDIQIKSAGTVEAKNQLQQFYLAIAGIQQ